MKLNLSSRSTLLHFVPLGLASCGDQPVNPNAGLL